VTRSSYLVGYGNALGEVPELAGDRISLVAASPLPGIVERAERLLTHAIKCQSRLGERFRMGTPELSAVTYSQDGHEVEYLARLLKEEGLINVLVSGGYIQVTSRGYMRYEALQTQRSASARVLSLPSKVDLSQVRVVSASGCPSVPCGTKRRPSGHREDPPYPAIASWIPCVGVAPASRARLRARPEVATMAEGGPREETP
jgi:hypothetical protein